MKNNQTQPEQTLSPWHNWRGLGYWNFYFLIKFILLWGGYLNFHALENLIFLAFLLFPLPSDRLHRLRQWIAIPIGFALFYRDTWLPGLDSILSQGSQLAGFSTSYLLELVNRFINWSWVGAGLVLWVGYQFVSQWVRVTLFTVLALVWLNLLNVAGPAFSLLPSGGQSSTNTGAQNTTAPQAATNTGAMANAPNEALPQDGPPNNANLSAYLDRFYQAESTRHTDFPASLPADAQPFDILVINICSLAWADVEASNLMQHPLWGKFDILFSNFNSATSYSGPASLRLLRASCGQPSHTALYQPAAGQCYLFDNLIKLGFTEQLAMDHSGKFGNYLNELRSLGNLRAPLMSQQGLKHNLTAFDGEPIYDFQQLMARWLQERENAGESVAKSATFVNLIQLHDGNRFAGNSKPAQFKPRAQTLFDQLNAFLDELQKSGRKVLVIVAPEHGAALVGDKMQLSGLRDIPSPNITHVPVGIKLIGEHAPAPAAQIKIDAPSSYLAVSEIVARLVDGKNFTAPTIDWQALTQNLPQTPVVSENENAITMKYQDKIYIKLNKGNWVPYPL